MQNDDEQYLASLGYREQLFREMGGFSNFAISFTIISILAGCFTTYGAGWNNGGPVAISRSCCSGTGSSSPGRSSTPWAGLWSACSR